MVRVASCVTAVRWLGHTISGGVTSLMDTCTLHVALFPEPSVMVVYMCIRQAENVNQTKNPVERTATSASWTYIPSLFEDHP